MKKGFEKTCWSRMIFELLFRRKLCLQEIRAFFKKQNVLKKQVRSNNRGRRNKATKSRQDMLAKAAFQNTAKRVASTLPHDSQLSNL